LSDLQFPHWSASITEKDGRLTKNGHLFLLGLWTRSGSGASPVVNGAPTAAAGATYGATEQQLLNDVKDLLVQIRQIMVDNGTAV
jgi:hypothetical protein